MRVMTFVMLAVALGCAPRPTTPPPPPVAAPLPSTPRRIELTQGNAVDVGDGTMVKLESVLYSHLSDSRNQSLLTMEVTRGAEHERVTLDRLDPVGAAGPKYRVVLGLRMAIDYVDAYHQPSTAAILVLR